VELTGTNTSEVKNIVGYEGISLQFTLQGNPHNLLDFPHCINKSKHNNDNNDVDADNGS